ncbi:hypothetical protein DIPPA_13662 [Diplonema papillatum]|nr:hypothetical protein DIPPA_13662 [Diplonema papillatum]
MAENQRLQENPLKSRLDTREQEAADLKTKLSVASESLSKRNLEYDQLRRHLETVEANLLQAETYKRGEQEQRAQAQLKRAIAAIQQQDTPSSDASPALQHYLAKQKQPIALNPASRSTQDTPRSTAAQPVRHSHGVKEAISSSVGVAIDPSKDPMSSEPKPPGRHGSTPVASPASSAPAYAKAKQLADNHLAALLDKANRQPKRESITWSRDNRR